MTTTQEKISEFWMICLKVNIEGELKGNKYRNSIAYDSLPTRANDTAL